jgi:hypothetical protein
LLLLAWFAEYEGERIAERTKEGLAHRRFNGLSAGRKFGTYIQAFGVAGGEIPLSLYDKKRGDYKANLPDTQFLDQLLELLALQKALNARGRVLHDYCAEKGFKNRAGKEWWRSSSYMNSISKALKKVRRLAVLGQLPDAFNQRVLAITRDTPASVRAKWKRKVRPAATPTAVPSEVDREIWSAADWQKWFAANRTAIETRFAMPEDVTA